MVDVAVTVADEFLSSLALDVAVRTEHCCRAPQASFGYRDRQLCQSEPARRTRVTYRREAYHW